MKYFSKLLQLVLSLLVLGVFLASCSNDDGDGGNNAGATEITATAYTGSFTIGGTAYKTLKMASDNTYHIKGDNGEDTGTYALSSGSRSIANGTYIFYSKTNNGKNFYVVVSDLGIVLESGSLDASGSGTVRTSSEESSGDDENSSTSGVSAEDLTAYNAMDDSYTPIPLPESVGVNELAGITLEREATDGTSYKWEFSDTELFYYKKEADSTDWQLTDKYEYSYNSEDKIITFRQTAQCTGGVAYTSPKKYIEAKGYVKSVFLIEYYKSLFTKLHQASYNIDLSAKSIGKGSSLTNTASDMKAYLSRTLIYGDHGLVFTEDGTTLVDLEYKYNYFLYSDFESDLYYFLIPTFTAENAFEGLVYESDNKSTSKATYFKNIGTAGGTISDYYTEDDHILLYRIIKWTKIPNEWKKGVGKNIQYSFHFGYRAYFADFVIKYPVEGYSYKLTSVISTNADGQSAEITEQTIQANGGDDIITFNSDGTWKETVGESYTYEGTYTVNFQEKQITLVLTKVNGIDVDTGVTRMATYKNNAESFTYTLTSGQDSGTCTFTRQ